MKAVVMGAKIAGQITKGKRQQWERTKLILPDGCYD